MPESLVVAFDEAGNTGQNLLDANQPAFAMASVHMSDEEAIELTQPLKFDGALEAHFARLKNSSKGRRALERFLSSSTLTIENAKLHVVDKSYMVTAKVVDLLIEPLMHAQGVDLYVDGANVALTNILHLTTPAVCGQTQFLAWQQAFINLVRHPTETTRDEFYNSVQDLRDVCRSQELGKFLTMLDSTRPFSIDLSDDIGLYRLDPAIPVFVALTAAWGIQLKRPFDLIHDDSKPIENARAVLEDMMRPHEEFALVGYDRRILEMPLRATGIQMAESGKHPSLQVADIIASAGATWAASRLLRKTDKKLLAIIENSPIPHIVTGVLWPSSAISRQDMETTGGPVGGGMEGMEKYIS